MEKMSAYKLKQMPLPDVVQSCINGKWNDLLKGKLPLRYAVNGKMCNLCIVNYMKCHDCPVKLHTGEINCGNTPVYLVMRMSEIYDKYEYNCEIATSVQMEIDFLAHIKQIVLEKEKEALQENVLKMGITTTPSGKNLLY